MATMREEHCCSVTLIIVGDDLEPDAVTSALGWHSDRSWRRGERKRFARPDGTELVFDSVHDRGGWKLFTVEEAQTALAELEGYGRIALTSGSSYFVSLRTRLPGRNMKKRPDGERCTVVL